MIFVFSHLILGAMGLSHPGQSNRISSQDSPSGRPETKCARLCNTIRHSGNWSYPVLVEYLGLGFQACEGTRRNGSTPVTSVYGLWVINFLYLQQFVERAEGVLEASKRLPTQFVLK